MSKPSPFKGLGNPAAELHVFMENALPILPYSNTEQIMPVTSGELTTIGNQTSNHWRKVFNVYAKLMQALYPNEIERWQTYRDNTLLSSESNQSLVYSPICYADLPINSINVVMGKTYANKQGLTEHCHWLSNDFAVNKDKRLIICPYFDYRQLTNEKITLLAKYINMISNDALPRLIQAKK